MEFYWWYRVNWINNFDYILIRCLNEKNMVFQSKLLLPTIYQYHITPNYSVLLYPRSTPLPSSLTTRFTVVPRSHYWLTAFLKNRKAAHKSISVACHHSCLPTSQLSPSSFLWYYITIWMSDIYLFFNLINLDIISYLILYVLFLYVYPIISSYFYYSCMNYMSN